MKAINCTLFVKKGKEGSKARFWIGVSTPELDESDKVTGWVQASMPARLSKDAKIAFKEFMVKTKTNEDVQMGRIAINDGWLKAAKTKDGETFVYIFINKLAKRETNPSDEDDF